MPIIGDKVGKFQNPPLITCRGGGGSVNINWHVLFALLLLQLKQRYKIIINIMHVLKIKT